MKNGSISYIYCFVLVKDQDLGPSSPFGSKTQIHYSSSVKGLETHCLTYSVRSKI